MITSLTRIWLTRSLRPFTFTDEYEQHLKFESCENMGLYLHIPFCRSICSFCPYCKELYEEKKCHQYIDHLIEEIHMVGSQCSSKKQVTSLYFGGGTPALAIERLEEILFAIKQYFVITEGIGMELHPEDVASGTLFELQRVGVTKISIGMQSFQDKFLSVLGRRKIDIERIGQVLQGVSFETVSMDLIFALPDQNIDDLKSDIDMAFSNGANHIAIYPYIDFSFTSSAVATMSKRKKRKLLDEITMYCKQKGYVRDSIWTFSNREDAKYSSMTRDNFLGFGCSATTLLKDQFKINTFSIEEYQKRIVAGSIPTSLTIRFSERQRMLYFLFWTAYRTRIDSGDFEHFFGIPLKKMYGLEFFIAKGLGFITEEKGIFHMTPKGAFYYHYYENYYTLSYIDKMWSIMTEEAFPDRIEF